MNYRFTKYDVDPTPTSPRGEVYRPQVVLRLSGPAGDLFLLALVDTGADETIVPYSVADQIGIQVDDQRRNRAGGITGQHLELLAGQVELEIIGSDQSFRWSGPVSFAKFESPDDECAILGHVGTLRYFTATFDGERQQGTLTPNRIFPGSVDEE